MGCGTETTTTVKTGDLSERGQSYDDLFMQLMQQNLSEFGGYDIVKNDKVEYKDPQKASELQGNIADLDAKIAKWKGDPSLLANLKSQKAQLEQQLAGIGQTSYSSFDLKKKEDIRVQDAIDKYGPDSPQVQAVKQQIKQEEVDKAYSIAGTEKLYFQNLQKLASGDYSYTPQQAQQISKFIDPIKGIIEKTSSDLLTQFGSSDKQLRAALDQVSKQIDQTGYDVNSALKAANLQYEKSGDNLMGVLQKVTSSANAKAQFEFDLLSEESDTKAAQQAALLGLPPGSMAEKLASQKMKTDALKQIELTLANQEAQGALQIQGGVEAGKQQISLAQVSLASSQGEKKEGVAKTGLGLTEALTNKIESVLGNKGNALTQLEQQKQNMLYGAAYGNLAGQLGAAQGGLAFNQGQKMNEFNLQNALMGPVQQQLGVEQQRQFAETTTKQKQQKGFLDSLTDVVGAAGSIAGMAMGIPSVGGGGGGGGGGGPQTYMPAPTQIDLSTFKPQPQGQFYLNY